MKKLFKHGLSLILCLCLVFGTVTPALAIAGNSSEINSSESVSSILPDNVKTDFNYTLASFVNKLSNMLINVIGNILNFFIPSTSAIKSYSDFNIDDYGNFYSGTEEFLDSPSQEAQWNLGYAQQSIMPDDFGEVPYTMGGYDVMAQTTESYDDLCVRTIVLNDNSGRGSVAFCVLDAIGISNYDVRLIRAALSDFAKENNIVSINVSVTHTHSGIDLQGVWDNTLDNVINNLTVGNLGITQLQSGVNRKFLNTVIEKTAQSVKDAYADMTAGVLTLAEKNIGENYLHDRTAPYNFDGNLYRLVFTPFDITKSSTIIASFSAHPEKSGYEHTVISGDFVPYIEQVVNKAGYNFIYIQGCVGTVTYSCNLTDDGIDELSRYESAVRYGHEIGYVILGMTKTQAECKALNYELGDLLGYSTNSNCTPWYSNWTAVKQENVLPILNIAHKQYEIEVSNVLMNIIGKSGITDYLFLYDNKTAKYYSITECGYMELGNSLKVLLNPGETYGEILMGGKGLEDFEYESYRELFGENVIVFDLVNDAIGYIQPDSRFVMAGIEYSEEKDEFDGNTWCLISYGKNTASKVVGEFAELVETAIH